MGKLHKEHEIIGKGKSPRTIRRQHCLGCNTVLALEITDNIGFVASSEYWWQKNGMWVKERWFGNWTKCPDCGREGNLPGDKPLSWEDMVTGRGNYEVAERIRNKLEAKIKRSNNAKN